jgi:hypothetical protein
MCRINIGIPSRPEALATTFLFCVVATPNHKDDRHSGKITSWAMILATRRGEGRIRTYVAVKQRIYSPSHLTTLAPPPLLLHQLVPCRLDYTDNIARKSRGFSALVKSGTDGHGFLLSTTHMVKQPRHCKR